MSLSRPRVGPARHAAADAMRAGEHIQLGDDLQLARCLSTAEVHLFLADPNRTLLLRVPPSGGGGIPGGPGNLAGGTGPDPKHAANVAKFNAYCAKFAISTDPNAVVELRKLIEDDPELGNELHEFEIAQLLNLAPSEISDLRALIPSMARFSEAALQDLVDALLMALRF
ncbi:HRDC-like protein [Blastocladiella britannica]|nr:HRDC-like protein [Blastocladiella britannica]